MKKLFIILIFFSIISNVSASIKENIIKKFTDIKNVSFDFEQNINGKIENGNCIIEYPKKIYCKYNLDQREVSDDFVNFNFTENENEINLFFDKKTYNLVGWQTVDIYQNVSITYLSSIRENQQLKEGIFKLPK